MSLNSMAVAGVTALALMQALAAGAAAQSIPPGPVEGTVMRPGYAKAVAHFAYAWGWPLVNMQSRRMMYEKVPVIGKLGPTPVAPLNQ